jgi:hypothetical protein
MIENWQILRSGVSTTRPGIRLLIITADLGRAMKRTSQRYREVVFWHGLVGLSEDRTAELLQISHQAVAKRYRYAIEEIVFLINGGT